MSAISEIRGKIPSIPLNKLGQVGGILKREYLDHRTGFVTVPLVFAAFMAIGILYGAFFGHNQFLGLDIDNIHVNGDNVTADFEYGIERLNNMNLRSLEKAMGIAMAALMFPILMIIPFVITFGLLGTLYNDRKNRSFLFWKSMPVSDTKEVLSKLFAIAVMGPAIIVGIAALVQLFAMVVGSVFGMIHDIPAASFIWNNVPTLSLWLGLIANIIVLGIWALPVLGWFMAVSAFAPRAPLLVAAVPIAGAIALEAMFMKSAHFASWLGGRLSGWALQIDGRGDIKVFGSDNPHIDGPFLGDAWDRLSQGFASGEFWFSTALGVGLIAGAIYLRRYNV